MKPEVLLSAQRELRDKLLDGGLSHEEHGLAAELLLYLDDPAACWAAGASWLLARTGADRISGGYVGKTGFVGLPAVVRPRGDIDQKTARRFAAQHQRVSEVTHRAEFAIKHRGTDVGLICVETRNLRADAHDGVEGTVRNVMAPVLAVARTLRQARCPTAKDLPGSTPRVHLTDAELRVAQLALDGCSYKEIAHRLERSWSTVDHQLRSLRGKLGVNSTAKLVRELSHYVGQQVSA